MVETGNDIEGHQILARLSRGAEGELFLALSRDHGSVVLATWPLDSGGTCPQQERAIARARERQSFGSDLQLLSHGIWPPTTSAWASFTPVSVPLGLLAQKLGLLDEARTLAIARAVAQALLPLHGRGLSSGGLTTERVLIDPQGDARLSCLELPGGANGLPAHLKAPELFDGHPGGPRSDAWSLGVLLYTFGNGFTPFGDGDATRVREGIARGLTPAWPASWSRPTIDFVHGLLSTDPAARPGDASALLDATLRTMGAIGLDPEECGVALGACAHDLLGELSMGAPSAPAATELMERPDDGTELMPPPAAAPAPAAAPEDWEPTAAEETKLMPPPAELAEDFDDDLGPEPANPVTPASPPMPPPPPPTRAVPMGPPPEDAEEIPAPPPPDSLRFRRTAPTPDPQRYGEGAPGDFPQTMVAAPPVAELDRRSAARWYARMNPHENFPLDVVVSGGKISLHAGHGTKVTLGEGSFQVDEADPLVEIQPQFPGCLVAPSTITADVTPETLSLRFWVTPLATGDLEDACVHFRHRGRLVQTLRTPSRVVGRTATRLLAVAGIVGPIILQFLEGFGWSLPTEVEQGFPLLRKLDDAVFGYGVPIALALLLLLAAFAFHLLTRPKKSGPPAAAGA